MDKEVVCCSNKSNSLERKNNDHEVTKKQEMPYERGFVLLFFLHLNKNDSLQLKP